MILKMPKPEQFLGGFLHFRDTESLVGPLDSDADFVLQELHVMAYNIGDVAETETETDGNRWQRSSTVF